MFKIEILFYSILHSLLLTGKNGITKKYLNDYISNTSILNFIFIKHIIKTILYLSILAGLYLFNKYYLRTINYSKPSKSIIIFVIIVGLLEILTAFPFYEAFKRFKLSYFIPASIIIYTLMNTLLSHYILKEKFSYKVILGTFISIIGIYILLTNGSD